MKTESQSLVNEFAGAVGLPRFPFAFAVGLVLTVLLLAAAYADGHWAEGYFWVLWQNGLKPAIVVYILCTSPLLQRRWASAIEALGPLAARPELLQQAQGIRRRNEWAAFLVGAVFSFWISSAPMADGRWLRLHEVVSNALMFGLLALAIYEGLLRSRQLSRVVHGGLHLDLFDQRLLTPLTRWGQAVSLSFVGGTCLSLLFQSPSTLRTAQSIVIYAILVTVSLTLFFTSIWSIHDALVVAQQRELAVVRRHRDLARADLKHKLAGSGRDDIVDLYLPSVVVGAHERQILSASTWPFNPKTVKELIGSLVAPFLIYGIKLAIGLSGP